MDTNNGVFIRGAKKFTENYLLKIGGLINDKNQTVEVTQVLIDTPSSTMIAEDIAAIRGMIAQRGKSHLLTPNRDKMLADLITKLQSHIYKTSRQLLDVRYIEIPMTDDFTREQQEREFKRLEIGDEFNSLLMLL
jgi:VIT1/CCC1 family predicted Fe2+/Mn2+ transporter